MSVQVLAAVTQGSEATLATRLVQLILADGAGHDGICWKNQATIAKLARVDKATVRRAISRLEELQEIEVRKAQVGRVRMNVYRLWRGADEPDYERLPFQLEEPFGTTTQSARSSSSRPCNDASDDRAFPPDSTTPTTYLEELSPTGESLPRARPFVVDRRRTTDSELTLAQFVLAAWNGRTGQSLTAKGWLAKIVMRHREHPELSLDDHVGIIERNLAAPWWRDDPNPSVIYGNDAIFERAMQVRQKSDPERLLEQGDIAGALRAS